jgi:hypothetical protein
MDKMGVTIIYSKLCTNPHKGRTFITDGKRNRHCYLECEYLTIYPDNDYECSKNFMEDNNDE